MSNIIPISEMDTYFETFDLQARIKYRELHYEGCVLNDVPEQGIKYLREVILLRAEKIIKDHGTV